jgi:hypothetical protein
LVKNSNYLRAEQYSRIGLRHFRLGYRVTTLRITATEMIELWEMGTIEIADLRSGFHLTFPHLPGCPPLLQQHRQPLAARSTDTPATATT